MDKSRLTSIEDEKCAHHGITRYLVMVALLTKFPEKRIEDIEYEKYSLRFKCSQCARTVLVNVDFIGKVFRSENILMEFRNVTSTEREILDFTRERVSADMMNKVFKWMNPTNTQRV